MKSSVNKFAKGLVQDVSDINESNDTYNDSMNGSLIYNDNGNYDWVVKNGNKFSFSIEAQGGIDANTKYIPIGGVGNNDIKVLFSVHDTTPGDVRSEIGVFSSNIKGVGTYKTLFNDRLESAADKLNFNSTNQITARFLYENDGLIRVYWVDGVESDSNPPRSFTFKFNGGDKGDANNYEAVTTSSHSINAQAKHNIGIIKYEKRISGNLKSGCYQYTYRCITEDGYATPWITPTRRSFLTTDAINSIDWSLYEMEGSGLDTSYGNRIKIVGIDQRYKDIEVCYIFCETPSISTEAAIFVKETITGGTMEFDHTSMGGTEVIAETIGASFAGIRAAKTLDIKDSTLYFGNIVESTNVITDEEKEQIFENLTITPLFRHMRSDEYGVDLQTSPLTHQTPKTGTLTKSLNQSENIDFTVDNDYVNYKGTQVDKEFSGYWRGETYRFNFVAVDNTGIPLFALHLADFKFPQQHKLDYSWVRLKADGTTAVGGTNLTEYPWLSDNYGDVTGTDLWNEDSSDPLQDVSKIRIMGLRVSGLDISGIKGKISGFHIVRADRDATILAQGMALPCLRDRKGQATTTDPLTRPFQFVTQRFDVSPTPSLGPYDQEGYEVEHSTEKFHLRENIIGFHAPDYDFDQSYIPIIQASDRLKIVGCSTGKANPDSTKNGKTAQRVYFSYYNWRPDILAPVGIIDRDKGGQHTLTKQYYTKNTAPFSAGTVGLHAMYDDECEITDSFRIGLQEKKIYNPTSPIEFDTSAHFVARDNTPNENPEGYTAATAGLANSGGEYRGQEKITTYYITSNFTPSTAVSAVARQNTFLTSVSNGVMGGFIVNYVRPNDSVYGGLTETSLYNTVSYSTGHFQPVNNPAFSTPAGDIYNDIDIWGGDCYVDYIAFLRTYPRYWENPNTGVTARLETDIAHGVSMPYESSLNFALRQAPSVTDPFYSRVGALPQDTYDDVSGAPMSWINGLYNVDAANRLLEEFNVNGVLLQREVIKFFSAEPQDFTLVNKYPVRWRYSGEKIYGDVIDKWRTFLAFDFNDLNGSYGQITSSTFYNNQIYTFQESAFGRLRAQDRAIVNTSVGGLTTGTGAILDGVDYISTKYGNQHQFSMINSGRSIYWVDVDKRKAMRFAGDGRVSLSDVRGLHTFFKYETSHFYNEDSPAGGYGICGVFDYENNNVMWSFVRNYHEEITSDIVINSEDVTSDSYYSNNNTIFVNGNGGNIIFPETNWFGDVNKSSVYYVANKSGAVDIILKTANTDTGVLTDIATISGGEYYEVKRDSNTSAWTATEVDLEDITPSKGTVVYNEDLNSFQGFFSFRPTFYLSHRNLVFSHDKDFDNIENKIYVHNLNTIKANYYGQNYKSYISLNVNENEYATKVFDSIRLNANEQCYTDYSRFLFNTEKQYYYYDVKSDTRLKYVEDSIRMPVRTFNQKDRTRGKWVNFIFEFKNNDEIPVKLYNLITNHRVSNRF
jgi:hypothetical protein